MKSKIFYVEVAFLATLGLMVVVMGGMVLFTNEDYLVILIVGMMTGFFSSIFWSLGYDDFRAWIKGVNR